MKKWWNSPITWGQSCIVTIVGLVITAIEVLGYYCGWFDKVYEWIQDKFTKEEETTYYEEL